MRQINKKLIVSDFDGTLLNSKNEITQCVKNAINEYVDCGGIFAVCTGRMLKSILPRVKDLGLKGLVVAYQGSVIADIQSGRIIRKNSISSENVAAVCGYAERFGFTCNTYSEEILYSSTLPSDGLETYEKVTGVKAVNVNIPMSEFIIQKNLACHKITFLVDPIKREYLYGLLKKEFDEKFDVTCSAAILVEISPKGDNKGVALKFIADYYNIDMDSTVAIGDNLNDLPMIKAASVGVAVGNAVEELKREADYVSVSNDENAVAKIIEKFGFK